MRTARPHRGAILGTVPGTRFEGRKASERGTWAERRRLRTCSEPPVSRQAGPPTSSFGRFRVRGTRRRRRRRARHRGATLRRDARHPHPTDPGLARPRRHLLADLDGREPGHQPDVRPPPDGPPRDGRARGRPPRVHRPVQLADLRGRAAARAAVGRVGRQVQPQGGHRPQRARRGRRVRRRRPVARAVAARAEHDPHRLPAGQHRGDAGRHPRRRAASAAGRHHRRVRGVVGHRHGPRADPRGRPHRRRSAGSCRGSSGCPRRCPSGPRCW